MKKFTLGLIAIAAVGLSACGSQTAEEETSTAGQEEKGTIIVGTSPGPYSELFLDGIVPILENQGYSIEEVEFTDLRSADVAMQDGDIDVNVDQHLAYMENFNAEAGANLAPITPVPTVPTGIHSNSKTSIDAVAEGDQIGIPNDASNTARALLLLQKAEWIKLNDTVEPMQVTTSDIVENPLALEIVEMDSAQIPRSLADLDYGVIPGSILYAAGMSSKDSLLNEDLLPQLVLHAVVNEENQDTPWAQDIVEAYRSEEFLASLEEVNTDNYWFIPEELQQ